jgi:hypothetical protein
MNTIAAKATLTISSPKFEHGGHIPMNIMTDMTGQYNKVVMVTKFDSLSAYENSWKEMEDSEEMKKMQEKMKGYTEMYLTGSREIYKVW